MLCLHLLRRADERALFAPSLLGESVASGHESIATKEGAKKRAKEKINNLLVFLLRKTLEEAGVAVGTALKMNKDGSFPTLLANALCNRLQDLKDNKPKADAVAFANIRAEYNEKYKSK